jgi:hypothetical protein
MLFAFTGKKRRRASPQSRALLIILSVAALALGVVGIALGLVVQSNPESRDAQLLEVGAAYTAPDRVPFVGDLVVYGAPTDGERPDLEALGCVTTSGDASTKNALREDRLVVDDRGLVPLVSFAGEPGHSIGCNGPAAVAAAPLYVAPGANGRHLIPLAGYSVGALGVPLGLLGLLSARASRV